MHRDIKPENFLLGAPTLISAPAGTASGVLKISDFGVSAFYQPGEVSRWLFDIYLFLAGYLRVAGYLRMSVCARLAVRAWLAVCA